LHSFPLAPNPALDSDPWATILLPLSSFSILISVRHSFGPRAG
jgi:hypothetical protein